MSNSLGYYLTYSGSSFSPGLSFNPDYFNDHISQFPFRWDDASSSNASSANDVELVSGADNGVNFNSGLDDATNSMLQEAIINKSLMDYQSKLNASSAQAQQDFNSLESQKNRDWIDKQRSTQYQTVVEDLKKAGLNPALAYSNGGSGVFGAGSASSSALGVNGSSVSNPIGQIISATMNSAASIANTNTSSKTHLISSLVGLASSAIGAYAMYRNFNLGSLERFAKGFTVASLG